MRTDHVIALLGRVRERAHGLISAELERRGHPGLVPSHGAILAKLYEHGPLPMGVLAREIDRRKNTVTTLVKKLEDGGYVHRLDSPADSRVTLIALTPKGEAFRADFKEVSDLLLRAVWGDMEDSQKTLLVASLERVLANLA